jgi:hypothetical protein
MRGVLQERSPSGKACGRRRIPWIRLREPYTFNRFHFIVEVRVRGRWPAMSLGESDVRILGPACKECGSPMTRIEAAPNYERYACRKGDKHCEYWVGRISHLGFSEFVAEHLRPTVYQAILSGALPMEAQKVAQVQ